jgi:hypothetical protein
MRLTTRVRLFAVAFFAVVASLLLPAPAVAAPIDEAKKAFAEGKAAFERGDYETALSAYQHANMILPAPNLYYNIGTTYERLGRYQEAALAFDKYFELAGAPQNDEDKGFQEKLRARADADRHRANVTPPRPTPQQPAPPPPQPQQPPPMAPPQQLPPAYYAPPGYYAPPPGLSHEVRLQRAKSRRTRAIVLMSIGVPLSLAGIGVTGWAAAQTDSAGTQGVGIFLGGSAFVVGVTLWAPGAASFVRSSREIKELKKEESPQQPLPPSPRGF